MAKPSSSHYVLVNGSERRAGSTAKILEHAKSKLSEHSISSEILHLVDWDISPCGKCGDCNWRSTPCEFADSMPEIVEKLKAANGLIYAAPVHAFGLSSTMQVFIERLGVGYLRFERPLTDKIGGVISVGRRYSHTEVVTQLYQNMLLNRMIIPGAGYPAMIRTEQGDPLDDVEGVASVNALCARLADVTNRLVFKDSKSSLLTANERFFG